MMLPILLSWLSWLLFERTRAEGKPRPSARQPSLSTLSVSPSARQLASLLSPVT
jgi:hypothetical protein